MAVGWAVENAGVEGRKNEYFEENKYVNKS